MLSCRNISKTLILPKSRFPNRHDAKNELCVHEALSQAYSEQEPSRKPYIIHDGPPYANGQIHLGHAINKILKDVAARYAMISGNKVEFIAGWDCHGLPIELKIAKSQPESGDSRNVPNSDMSPENFRSTARSFAKSQIDLQMTSFKRIGLLTDWNKRYTTDDPSYISNQLRAFAQLTEAGLIFKDLLPVHWSTVNSSSVADADIEYRSDHVSNSAYVGFELRNAPFFSDSKGPIKLLIWTTTPWTLVQNRAIAFNKKEKYCIVRICKDLMYDSNCNDRYLIACESIVNLQEILALIGYKLQVELTLNGEHLNGLKYKSLDGKEDLPMLHANFVDPVKGTGLVHIAPNYGEEDFDIIKSHKLEVPQAVVDAKGRFSESAGDHLKGKFVLTDGNDSVLEMLSANSSLLCAHRVKHAYPYELRTGRPVITRTSQQMFLDTTILVLKCLKALEKVSFYPEHRREYFVNCLKERPNWCISRQRLWGTPIPVLYRKDDVDQKNFIINRDLIDHYCKLVYKLRFIDYWWTLPQEQLVPQELLDKNKLNLKSEDLVRGTDIFDVWVDSGLSWHTTTVDINDKKTMVDLYMEGQDQTRGWFQSSLLLSVALRECAPSKRIYMHGFVLDERGAKMSKSKGNVVDPIALFQEHGVDPVRLWVSIKAGTNNDIIVKPQEIKAMTEAGVNRYRLTMKFLMGCLADFNPDKDMVDLKDLPTLDAYFMDKMCQYAETVKHHYDTYRYDMAAKCNLNFIINEVSPLYISSMKDTLYCDSRDAKRRRASQTVLYHLYNIMLRTMYPIMPHVVHEAIQHMPAKEPLNQWKDLGYESAWSNIALRNQMDILLTIRRHITQRLSIHFEQMQDFDAILILKDRKLFKQLERLRSNDPNSLAELFKTTSFNVAYAEKLNPPAPATLVTNSNEIASNNNTTTSEISNADPLTTWKHEHDGSLILGGSLPIEGGKNLLFELNYTRSNALKCIRCRRYRVLQTQDDHHNICSRCSEIVNDARHIEGDDVGVITENGRESQS